MFATMKNDGDQVARVETMEDAGAASQAPEARAIVVGAEDAVPASQSGPAPEAPTTNTTADDAAAAPRADKRDDKGRFLPGHPGGPGNPFAREVARMRKRILAKLTDEELDAITNKLIEQAKEGDVASAKLLFSYGLGKPTAAPDPDRLDTEEWK